MINEIAWMGTKTSYSDEWIELYNNSSSDINWEEWTLKAKDGAPEIKLKGLILAKDYYILERTNEGTLPNIKADLIYKGSLNNKGEHIQLLDNSSNVVDEVNCEKAWFAGDNKTKMTMERKNSLESGNNQENWQTSQDAEGTPGAMPARIATRSVAGENSEQKIENKRQETTENRPLLIEKKTEKQENSSFLVFLVASVSAVFSSAMILTLKRKLKQNRYI